MSFKLPSQIFELDVLIIKKRKKKKKREAKIHPMIQSHHLYIQIPKRNASRYKTKHTDRYNELTFKKIFCLFFK